MYRNKNRKLPAFTIIEVVISMLVAAVVIGLSYSIYSIVDRSYAGYVKKNNEISVVINLDKLLKRDFDHAAFIKKTESGLLIIDTNKMVKWQLTPDYMVRFAGIIDTFKIKTTQFNINFNGMPVSYVNDGKTNNVIDELSFIVLLQGREIPCHYLKNYSSVNLFQIKN